MILYFSIRLLGLHISKRSVNKRHSTSIYKGKKQDSQYMYMYICIICHQIPHIYGSVHLAFKITHYMTEFIEIIKNFLFFVNLNEFAKLLINVFN